MVVVWGPREVEVGLGEAEGEDEMEYWRGFSGGSMSRYVARGRVQVGWASKASRTVVRVGRMVEV